MAKKSKDEESPEIAAFSAVYSALKDLDQTRTYLKIADGRRSSISVR